MRLRTRFVAAMAGFVVALTGLVACVATAISLRQAFALEEESVRAEVGDAQSFLAAESAALSRLTSDWAEWDDAYQFVADTNQAFAKANLVDSTFSNLRLHLMAFFDPAGRPVCVKAFDLDAGNEAPLPEPLMEQIRSSPSLLRHPSQGSDHTGLLLTGRDIWLLSSRPILTSRREGPIRGTLILGRRLCAAGQDRMPWYEHGLLTVHPVPAGARRGDVEIRTIGPTQIQGSVLVRDILGRRSVEVAVTLKRAFVTQTLSNEGFLVAAIMLCGAVVGLFAFLTIERWVLRGLTESLNTLRSELGEVAAGAHPDLPLRGARGDEMDELTQSINDMLAARSESQRELIQAQRLAALGVLVAGVSHEVNNPNSVIRLNAAALSRRLERLRDLVAARSQAAPEAGPDGGDIRTLRDEMAALASEIGAASGRIAALVQSLKAFGRPAFESMTETVSVNTAVREACALVRHQIEKKQCCLSLTLAEDLPAVRGNAQQLTQVMVNLIQNACDAAERPGTRIGVRTRPDVSKAQVCVTVEDDGPGIPAEILPRICDPFFTTRREHGGTGLGLSISAEIVRNHGGRIEIESVPGRSTQFTVILPLRRNESHAH